MVKPLTREEIAEFKKNFIEKYPNLSDDNIVLRLLATIESSIEKIGNRNLSPVWTGKEGIMDFVHNRVCPRKDCQNNTRYNCPESEGICITYHSNEIVSALEIGKFQCEKMVIDETEN